MDLAGLWDLLRTHLPDRDLLEAAVAGSAVLSVATLAGAASLLPRVVARLPEDHFLRSRAERRAARRTWRPGRLVAVVLRNALGAVLLIAGFVMLFVPGQGLLTMLIGLLVMDFPGKFALERALVRRPRVMRTLNRMRRRAGCPPLRTPDGSG